MTSSGRLPYRTKHVAVSLSPSSITADGRAKYTATITASEQVEKATIAATDESESRQRFRHSGLLRRADRLPDLADQIIVRRKPATV